MCADSADNIETVKYYIDESIKALKNTEGLQNIEINII